MMKFGIHADACTVAQRARIHAKALLDASSEVNLIAVTNEVGCGLVPETAIGRLFRDIQGWVNQQLAREATAVHLLTSGIPFRLK